MEITMFGYLLYHLRTEKGWTLRELGTLSGLDHAYLWRMEKGQKSHPSLMVINALSKALKVSAAEKLRLQAAAGHAVPLAMIEEMVGTQENEGRVRTTRPVARSCSGGRKRATVKCW